MFIKLITPLVPSSDFGPIPDNINSFGESTAPPLTITSLDARANFFLPYWTYHTPTALLFLSNFNYLK